VLALDTLQQQPGKGAAAPRDRACTLCSKPRGEAGVLPKVSQKLTELAAALGSSLGYALWGQKFVMAHKGWEEAKPPKPGLRKAPC